jgi:hypothetical protein
MSKGIDSTNWQRRKVQFFGSAGKAMHHREYREEKEQSDGE